MGLMRKRNGCKYYERRCKIRAHCCDETFGRRHCHNEATNSFMIEPLHRHDVPRHQVKTVICTSCGTEQDVWQHCIGCGVCMGKYFCQKCNFFDDDIALTCMLDMYRHKMVWILCNDCEKTSEVNFHIVAYRCLSCKSYNTREIRGGHLSSGTESFAEVAN